jgi:hypothetical protein
LIAHGDVVRRALLVATGTYDVTGRVLYVNGSTASPLPLAHARRIVLDPREREAALRRIADRTKEVARAEQLGAELARLKQIESAFVQLAEQASRDTDEAHPVVAGSPHAMAGAPWIA